jgi:ABC-type branched-subunit amino acid transport system ATPase component
MLRIDALSRLYGGLPALQDVSFAVEPGTICGLIGPNGAGKTTLINIVSGLLKPTGGSVFLEERDLTGLPPHRIAAAGVARTFQNIRLFGDLPVIDNVLIGRHLHRRDTLFEALFALPGARRAARENRAIAHALLERLQIAPLAGLPAAKLSYGDQRRVEIARALALEPRLLLLDEPAAGMNAAETDQLAELLLQLRGEGLTLLVIEHDMNLIMRVSDRVVVLNFGVLIAAGTPQQIRRDPEVVAAYLGDEDEHRTGVAG